MQWYIVDMVMLLRKAYITQGWRFVVTSCTTNIPPNTLCIQLKFELAFWYMIQWNRPNVDHIKYARWILTVDVLQWILYLTRYFHMEVDFNSILPTFIFTCKTTTWSTYGYWNGFWFGSQSFLCGFVRIQSSAQDFSSYLYGGRRLLSLKPGDGFGNPSTS